MGALRAAGELVWPSRALISSQREHGAGALPPDEFARLDFLIGAVCNRCGVPMEVDLGAANECAACIAKPPRWTRARAALAYDESARRPILDLKYAGRRDGLSVLGAWMVQAGQGLLEEADLLVPVPLHYRRLAARGYNQAVWLAEAISKRSGVPVRVDILRRIRATKSQGGLSARARRRNVAGAFDIRPGKEAALCGRSVLLIDDVLTTGATLSGCTRALLRAGAARVDVLVLARVVRGRDVTI